jgi:hypothetical protein
MKAVSVLETPFEPSEPGFCFLASGGNKHTRKGQVGYDLGNQLQHCFAARWGSGLGVRVIQNSGLDHVISYLEEPAAACCSVGLGVGHGGNGPSCDY